MHPEIRQVGPGSCPICGMALEPELVTADAGPNPELADMTRRLWIGLALTLPVFALEMGGHLTDLHMWLGQQTSNWIQLALATPVVLWAGWPFFERGWASLRTRNLNMFTLIAMGTGVAWAYSVVATLLPGLFPAALRGHDGAVPVYFEAAAVITVLVLLGQVLELKAREQTGGAIRALLDLAPKRARRIRRRRQRRGGRAGRSGGRRPPARAAGRERAGRRRGARGPQRGRRVDGDGRVHARRPRTPATKVIGGTMNQSGSFVMRADKVGRDTHAGADRADGGRGAAQPRADPAAGRPGLGLVRAAGDRWRRCWRSRPGRSGGRSRASRSA